MTGRPLKAPEQRRNRTRPGLGEWIELPNEFETVLPAAKPSWSPRVKRLWNGWRADSLTSQYTAADVAYIFDLADQFDELAEATQTARMDRLGLTPKGRRELRWRTQQEAEQQREAVAKIRKL